MANFFLGLWIPGEKRAKLKKISIYFEQQAEVGSTVSLDTQNTLYFLISHCSIASNFLNWKFLLYFWLRKLIQKLINKQIIIFYSPSNAPCSSDESIQIKHFKHHSSIGLISKKWISVSEDTSSLKQVEQIWKCALS